MRVRQNRLKRIGVCTRTTTKDKDYSPVVSYGSPQNVLAECWQTSDRLAVERYGERSLGMYTVKIPGNWEKAQGKVPVYTIQRVDAPGTIVVQEGDGLCIFTANDPDYTVVGIREYTPLRLEVQPR